jgi:hypothetical protein
MIKILLIIVLVFILYFSFEQYEKFQTLDEFYKLNQLIDIGDESKKFGFVEENITRKVSSYSNSAGLLITGGSPNLGDLGSNSRGITQNNNSNTNDRDNFTIVFENDKLILKQGNSIINNSNDFILNITKEGYYKFADDNDITINEEFIINVETDNVIIDGNNVVINLVDSNNKNGVIKNGSSTTKGHDNIIVKNIHFNYVYDSANMFGQSMGTDKNDNNGEGGICCSYFANGSKRNVIHNCYVSKKTFSNYSGGIVGKFAGCNSGELIVMNCIFSGLFQSINSTYGPAYIGGICGAYLGYNSGKIFVYNCSNYGAFFNPGCGGIIGGYAANKDSHVVVFGCSNLGIFSIMDKSGGIVGGYSCKNNSNLSILCCYCINDKELLSQIDEKFGGIVGVSSVLNKSIINIIMCYNNFIKYGEKFKYFIADVDESSNNNNNNSEQTRDIDSKINIDYCFNSTVSNNNNSEMKKNEFKVDSSNINLTNTGKIYLDDNSNLNNKNFLSNKLSSYNLNINGGDKSFPYNLIFVSHNEKINSLDKFDYLFGKFNGNSIVNLKQYFDTDLINETCSYSNTSNNNIAAFYKLKYNILDTGCYNDLTPSYDNNQYYSNFSKNQNYNSCKNKSIENCDMDKCFFKPFYEDIICFPDTSKSNNQEDNSLSSSKQMIECYNLNSNECRSNSNCNLIEGGICIPNI